MLNKRIVFLLATFFLVRLYLSFIIELGNDEVYYTLYARFSAWSHFDHPPGVGLLINISTLFFQNSADWLIRLGPVLLGTFNIFLVYRIASRYFSEQSAFIAALLYSLNLYTSIIAGVFILPDSPQLTFWILGLEKLIFITQAPQKTATKHWLLLGLYTALSILCKLHGVFLLFGGGLYILFFDRKKLVDYRLYLCAAIAFLGLAPTIIWNFQNDFLMYAYHSNRVGAAQINLTHFTRFTLGQLIYHNPFVFVAMILVFFNSKKFKTVTVQYRLILCIFFPLFISPLYNSLFKETLPHWSGPAYIGLILLAAYYLNQVSVVLKNTLIIGASSLYIAVAILAYPIINNGFLMKGFTVNKDKNTLGKGDFTLDIYGWQKSSESIFNYISKHDSSATLLSFRWFPTAHLDHYLARPNQLNILCLGDVNQQHEYVFINKKRKALMLGDNAWYISFSNLNDPLQEETRLQFEYCETPVYLPIYRNDVIVKYAILYHLKNYLPSSSTSKQGA